MSLGSFNKCCLCFDLRTGRGSFVIAYSILIWHLLQLVLCCLHLAGIKVALSEHHAMLVFSHLEFFKLILGFEILILVFEVLITISLLYGLHKKIQDQVQIFYVGGFVLEVLRLIILTMILMRYWHTMTEIYEAWQWFTFTVEMLSHVVYFYFLCALRRYYFQMRKEETNQRWNVFADS